MCLGVPGQIRERWEEGGALLARADFVGEERVIRLNYLPDLGIGDWTIVHAGFALTRLSEADAQQTIATMREVGLLDPAHDSSAQSTPGSTPDSTPESTTALAPGGLR